MDELAPVIVEFNTKSSTIFFSHYEKFKATVEKLDRKKDDNVFQLQQAKYLQTLKSQLEYLAQDLLNKYGSMRSANLLNKKFTDEINQYLNEFRQKSRSL
jgi:hypothetical protein